MKRYAAITVFVYLAFLMEFVLYNLFGPWGKPELMVLVIVFCNLYWGIRHSLWAAFVAGVLKGAFDIEPPFTYVLLFITCAYLTTFIRRTLYQPGSRFSRLVVSFFVLVCVFLLEFILHLRLLPVRFLEAAQYIFVPSLVLTMLLATLVFMRLKGLVVRYKI